MWWRELSTGHWEWNNSLVHSTQSTGTWLDIDSHFPCIILLQGDIIALSPIVFFLNFFHIILTVMPQENGLSLNTSFVTDVCGGGYITKTLHKSGSTCEELKRERSDWRKRSTKPKTMIWCYPGLWKCNRPSKECDCENNRLSLYLRERRATKT